MATIEIENVGSQSEVVKALTKEFDDLIDGVRRRAYGLFQERGGKHGSDGFARKRNFYFRRNLSWNRGREAMTSICLCRGLPRRISKSTCWEMASS